MQTIVIPIWPPGIMVFLCLGLFVLPSQARSDVQVLVSGAPTIIAAYAHDACEVWDIPDAPARAIRVAPAEVLLFASHFRNRVLRGADLRHLHHDCHIVFAGHESDDPADFDDRGWIASPYTLDGHRVFAIIHDEFQGNRRPALCPSGRYMDCWYNALTAAVSNDGGATFARVGDGSAAAGLVAALPYRYDELPRGHHGYFNPSNIVAAKDGLYMVAFATQALAQRPGNCLLRTDRVDDPAAWRAWDGSGFTVRFIDPYGPHGDPAAHVCAPVGAGHLRWPVTSLVRHVPSGVFVATMMDAGAAGGVYVASSADLLDWSAPVRVLDAAGTAGWPCGQAAPLAYPSLLDPASPAPSFDTVGGAALLFATRFNTQNCHMGADRDLIAFPVAISTPAR